MVACCRGECLVQDMRSRESLVAAYCREEWSVQSMRPEGSLMVAYCRGGCLVQSVRPMVVDGRLLGCVWLSLVRGSVGTMCISLRDFFFIFLNSIIMCKVSVIPCVKSMSKSQFGLCVCYFDSIYS